MEKKLAPDHISLRFYRIRPSGKVVVVQVKKSELIRFFIFFSKPIIFQNSTRGSSMHHMDYHDAKNQLDPTTIKMRSRIAT